MPGSRVTLGRAIRRRRLRADDGTRTRDPHLGKVMLYQLSHVRVGHKFYQELPAGLLVAAPLSTARRRGARGVRLTEAMARSAGFLSSSRASTMCREMTSTPGTASLPATSPKYIEPM